MALSLSFSLSPFLLFVSLSEIPEGHSLTESCHHNILYLYGSYRVWGSGGSVKCLFRSVLLGKRSSELAYHEADVWVEPIRKTGGGVGCGCGDCFWIGTFRLHSRQLGDPVWSCASIIQVSGGGGRWAVNLKSFWDCRTEGGGTKAT